jgi:hypothetical protein
MRTKMSDSIQEIAAKITILQAEEAALMAQEDILKGASVVAATPEPTSDIDPFLALKPHPDSVPEQVIKTGVVNTGVIRINPLSTYVAPDTRTSPAAWPLQPAKR